MQGLHSDLDRVDAVPIAADLRTETCAKRPLCLARTYIICLVLLITKQLPLGFSSFFFSFRHPILAALSTAPPYLNNARSGNTQFAGVRRQRFNSFG
jgi:hypothetical protein